MCSLLGHWHPNLYLSALLHTDPTLVWDMAAKVTSVDSLFLGLCKKQITKGRIWLNITRGLA